MLVLRRRVLPGPNGRHRWWIAVIALLSVIMVLFAFTGPSTGPSAAPVTPPSPEPTPSSAASASTAAKAPSPTVAPDPVIANPGDPPRIADFRTLAAAAATAIYTWDTRTSSYSEVYSRLRDWWEVLPDGSNPLAVLVQEFEATGVNAGSYATLVDQQAFRSATVESLHCDSELAEVQERPAPWAGLHVCTASVRVLDQSTSARTTYTAPVSVMVNCPPAVTAPRGHCAMVGFYTTPSRIIY